MDLAAREFDYRLNATTLPALGAAQYELLVADGSGTRHVPVKVGIFDQIAGVSITAFIFYRFLIRPWRLEGRPTTLGLFAVGFQTITFQDPFSNANSYWFTYNTNYINFGSWIPYLPFWNSPVPRIPATPIAAAR